MWPPSFQQITVACAICGAIIALIQKRSLEGVVGKLLAASAVPTGIVLVGCAFDSSLITKLSDLGLYLLAAAVALLYVSLKELFR
jgi:hypothetical protein